MTWVVRRWSLKCGRVLDQERDALLTAYDFPAEPPRQYRVRLDLPTARPPKRSFHLVFESHDGRACVPIPERSTSPRVTLTPLPVDSLKALDPNRPIREADSCTAAIC